MRRRKRIWTRSRPKAGSAVAQVGPSCTLAACSSAAAHRPLRWLRRRKGFEEAEDRRLFTATIHAVELPAQRSAQPTSAISASAWTTPRPPVADACCAPPVAWTGAAKSSKVSKAAKAAAAHVDEEALMNRCGSVLQPQLPCARTHYRNSPCAQHAWPDERQRDQKAGRGPPAGKGLFILGLQGTLHNIRRVDWCSVIERGALPAADVHSGPRYGRRHCVSG